MVASQRVGLEPALSAYTEASELQGYIGRDRHGGGFVPLTRRCLAQPALGQAAAVEGERTVGVDLEHGGILL